MKNPEGCYLCNEDQVELESVDTDDGEGGKLELWRCVNRMACEERQQANQRHEDTVESWVTEKKTLAQAMWELNRGFVLIMLKHEPVYHDKYITCVECNHPYPCPTMDMAKDATVKAREAVNRGQ